MRKFVKNPSSLIPSLASKTLSSQPGAARAVGREYNQSAQTRFDNDRQAAARASLGASLGTSNAAPIPIRPANAPINMPTSDQSIKKAPVQEPIITSASQALQAVRPSRSIETSNLDPEPEPQIDFDSLTNDYRLESLVRSPQFQSSVVKTQLQEYFRNRNNPGMNQTPDGQNPGIYAENILGNMRG